MGIPIELYRARVGLFHLSATPAVSSQSARIKKQSQNVLLTKFLPLIAIGILLLIAGIEPNPGPVCHICNLSLDSVPNYYRHVTAHSFRKGFKVPCYFKGCNQQFSSLSSLLSHRTRFHEDKNQDFASQQPAFLCKCPVTICGLILTSRKMYSAHMRKHLEEGKTFNCPFSNCNSLMKSKSQFATHFSRVHPKESVLATEQLPSVPDLPDISASTSSMDMETDHFEEHSETTIDSADFPSMAFSEPEDIFPPFVVKDEMARFYLKLEGKFLLPSSTVQAISEEIKVLSELSHHCLKRALFQELIDAGLEEDKVRAVVKRTFLRDPIFNLHHKGMDLEHLGTAHLRDQYWKQHFNFVEPQEIYLGKDDTGSKRFAHYVPIKQSVEMMLKDANVKELILQSFETQERSDNILSDFCDGSAFKAHQCSHINKKCIQILLFQDAFEFNPFGPAKGTFKPVGFYFVLGNLPPEHRSREEMINLVYMVLERYLNPSETEEVQDKDQLKFVLQPLIEELRSLKREGIVINGEQIPVCLMFCLGDNLGQHTIGGFVRSFSAEFFCRLCPISMKQFKEDPTLSIPHRTPLSYDNCVQKAKLKWWSVRSNAMNLEKKRREKTKQRASSLLSRTRAPGTKIAIKRLVSKDAYKKLCSISFIGVKSRPSPFNCEILNFHVCSPSLPPCIAHDLFEGIIKTVLAKILKYFINVKKWFDLTTLNRRIKNFKCKGPDARDAPTPLKSLDQLSGNASENWNMLRLLPFIIGDLIIDKDDEMWLLFLALKEITELVCAPKITMEQVAYLKLLINSFLSDIKKLEKYLPSCLTPKAHFLSHACDYIVLFGPLIRLFTLRYESKHTFFKKVARQCRNYINITYTLARKYVYRFAYDHSAGMIPSSVTYDSTVSSAVYPESVPKHGLAAFSSEFPFQDYISVETVKINGIDYKKGHYLVLSNMDATDLIVGSIEMILLSSSSNLISFLVEERTAYNTFNGYYSIQPSSPSKVYSLKCFETLVDYYPLPSYVHEGMDCLSLKHSVTCMI